MRLPDVQVELTVYITVKGSDYSAADFDNDGTQFVQWVKKNAREGIRHADLNIGDADVSKCDVKSYGARWAINQRSAL